MLYILLTFIISISALTWSIYKLFKDFRVDCDINDKSFNNVIRYHYESQEYKKIFPKCGRNRIVTTEKVKLKH